MKMLTLSIFASLTLACADFSKNVDQVLKVTGGQIPPTKMESVLATKQALERGVLTGTSMLQQEDGFLKSAYQITIPAELQSTTSLARQLGLGHYIDDFEVSLNRAAEQAIYSAMPIFKDAIGQLTFQDIASILTGPDNAATNYFRSTSEDKLEGAFMPIIAEATKKNDVSKIYGQIVRSVRPAAMAAGIQVPNVNLDKYVTSSAIEAVFSEIAVQEKKIRENPADRSSDLLKKVFTYYGDSQPKS